MFSNQKHVFWQALILTIFIFSVGVAIGFLIENSRLGKINELYVNSEVELLDVRIQSEMLNANLINCDLAIEKNIKFADKVYDEAKLLGRYEDAQRFSEALVLQHKKYDLLRTMVWVNSIKLKEKCSPNYHNIIYIYQYTDPSIKKIAEQETFSKFLEELKIKEQDRILLLPIAGDIGGISIEALKEQFNITVLPTVIIDEKTKITDFAGLKQIENLLK
ncbi:hypothetical protein COV15_00315 [Candidatus Woesearchaeota archaeon CG10_big_fil_rev_8_21_14_0_10_34_12]|nr:MAG: hypothetical protein COV15_00315 [Candidatus Woesearchaeota archaeon CG10_big_fil_rev_8_21_14_0_10_34_12]